MANSVTRCPKCETSFRVTEAHLNSAKGAVRCGSCLHIFNARDYLVSDLDSELVSEPGLKEAPAEQAKARPKTAASSKVSSRPKTKVQSLADEEDILIDDNMSDDDDDDIYSSDMGSNVIMATTFGPAESNLFERAASDGGDDDDDEDPDESWAESLLADDDEEPRQIKIERKAETPPKRELFKARNTRTGDGGNFYGTEPPKPPGSKSADDHFQLIEKLREDEHDYEPPLQQSKTGKRNDGPTIEELEGDYQDEYLSEEDTYEEIDYGGDGSEREPEIGDIDEIDDYAYRDQYGSTSNSRYLHSIEPEPVEFNIVTSYPIWQSKALWTGLACAAALILCIQIAIFRFDDLSVVQPWRGYYAKVCSVFSCELPQLRDRSLIKASNLVVRSHPTIDNALMVDAILRNTARFPQTFPPLDLVFIDIKNTPIAARRFEASEYLGGELAGKSDMPVNQPVHIAIEISDPGPKAVSYFITIPD